MQMRIDCYLSPECVSEDPLRANILEALKSAGLEANLLFIRIQPEAARRLGLKGSPAILLDGLPVFPAPELKDFS